MPIKNVVKIQPALPEMPTLLRVAAYARVSMETDRLTHSLAAQVSYFSDLIQKNPSWQYVGVYADEFVTGTNIEKRTEFQRLIKDCEAGLIDIVLVKSISRFARNTVDLLTAVRHLKEIGVEIRFEKENISTKDNESGELMLSLLAVFSQEESRSISENCKWGLRRRCQNGFFRSVNKRVFGYQYDNKQQKYIIIPEEAAIIKRIFGMFLDGIPLQKICDTLNGEGYRTLKGNEFVEATLCQMVKNEIYAVDLKRQKAFVVDHISHRKIKNRGQLPQYYLENAHDAIIDRETYQRVLAEIDRRSALKGPAYPFSHRIVCGCCGAYFTRKKTKTANHWICHSKKEVGKTCPSQNFTEQQLEKISASVLGMDEFGPEKFQSCVKKMTVLKNGNILFEMTRGKNITWKNRHLEDSLHITTSTPCFKGKIFCAVCGQPYCQHEKDRRWYYWRCRSKATNGSSCSNVNYPDYQLRQITAIVMGDDDFTRKRFLQQIDRILVFPDGRLKYHFKNGSVASWQKQ